MVDGEPFPSPPLSPQLKCTMQGAADLLCMVFLAVSRVIVEPGQLSDALSSIIAFRFIPNSVVTRPVAAVWQPVIHRPWYRIPRRIRLVIGWVSLLALIFGSAFGFSLSSVRLSTGLESSRSYRCIRPTTTVTGQSASLVCLSSSAGSMSALPAVLPSAGKGPISSHPCLIPTIRQGRPSSRACSSSRQ